MNFNELHHQGAEHPATVPEEQETPRGDKTFSAPLGCTEDPSVRIGGSQLVMY